jgi:phosphoribosylformylglycinamidine synthase
MRAKIIVYPRREILDPQGKAICDALHRVGFEQVKDVRAGKSFRSSSTRPTRRAPSSCCARCAGSCW